MGGGGGGGETQGIKKQMKPVREFEAVLEKVSRVGLAAITSLGARFHSGTVLNPAMSVLPFG